MPQESPRLNDCKWYKYVTFDLIEQYEKLGWVFVCQLEKHHNNYSVLMEWVNDNEPVLYKKENSS